jgi:hypothetical protein
MPRKPGYRNAAVLRTPEQPAATPAEAQRLGIELSALIRNGLAAVVPNFPVDDVPRRGTYRRLAMKVGDWVRVKPHTHYGDLRQGAVQSEMHQGQHNGFHRAKIESISTDGAVEVFVPGYGVDVVDVSHLEPLEEKETP